MRSYKDAVAFTEMARIQRKIRSGNATTVEKERYRHLLQRKESGMSVRLYPLSSPPPAFDHNQRPGVDAGWYATQYPDVIWKRVPRTSPTMSIRQTVPAFQEASQQKVSLHGDYHLFHSGQNSSSAHVKSSSVAYIEALLVARERAARWNEFGSDISCQVRLISPTKGSAFVGKTRQLSDESLNGRNRLHVPIPMRDNVATNSQMPVTDPTASKGSPTLVGILRNQTPSPPIHSSLPKIDPSAFMRAMRASQVTRGQQKRLLSALRESSAVAPKRSAFEPLRSSSKEKETKTKPAHLKPKSSIPKPYSSSPSEDEAPRARRLAWMRSAKEIMSQNLSPSVLKNDIKSNQNVSTTHLLRRIGNPHRRVIHQMLRDQNKRILLEMRKQIMATKIASSPHTSPPTLVAPDVATAAASK